MKAQDTQQKCSMFLELLEQEKEKLAQEMELLQRTHAIKEQERKIVSAESKVFQILCKLNFRLFLSG